MTGRPAVFTLRERNDPGPIEVPSEIRGASARAVLVSGVFGDPTLLLRLDHRRRCLLFDIGDVTPIPTKLINETTDIFISHAHLDHFGGFGVLLRKRIGNIDPIRLYGPPGIAAHANSFVNAFTWDRIDDRGPRFHILEYDGNQLSGFELVVGRDELVPLGQEPISNGVLLEADRFVVRSAVLDHGIPSLAYAYEESGRFSTRPERLKARGISPGDWLGDLKTAAASRNWDQEFFLPDGSKGSVREFADELLLEQPGQKIAYATDFADNAENRAHIVALARDAEIFVCEASFSNEDADQAERTGHLTARACAEIAKEAGVEKLLPFHFSSRYDRDPAVILSEIRAHAPDIPLLLTFED